MNAVQYHRCGLAQSSEEYPIVSGNRSSLASHRGHGRAGTPERDSYQVVALLFSYHVADSGPMLKQMIDLFMSAEYSTGESRMSSHGSREGFSMGKLFRK